MGFCPVHCFAKCYVFQHESETDHAFEDFEWKGACRKASACQHIVMRHVREP